MSGYALHPEASIDLDGIREHRAEDSPDAAEPGEGEIFGGIRGLVAFPDQAIDVKISLRARYGSNWCGNT